ncbi:hypothetical protein PR202_ga18241 [Eleusine coracana subsp. coracana]|uniref:PIR2-like helical domain-containing protein n=1 Tax=Eleusine coracana subsp. coracana TaxID=191504 RepID=A0AAV5CSL4_ELECO|nr:hypothetical protein PR202_ga18241 [Eleusine coracana subsp. coracana]
MGGYCYGPLDPVSNIIVNSVWFDLTLPGGNKHGKLEMISTKCLWRLVARSLYGLVCFLCTRYPCLTPDLALQRLLMSGADLRAADPYLLVGSNNNVINASVIPSTSVAEAYAAAAIAAFHPCPLAQQEFLGSSNVRDKLLELVELRPIKIDRVHSSEDLNSLSMAVLESASSLDKWHPQKEPVPMEVSGTSFSRAATCEHRFLGQLRRVRKMVEAALDTFNNNKASGSPFRLHVICGVNELVSGPEFSKDPQIMKIKFRPFLEQVRCIYCDLRGSRIVHTSKQSFHGHDIEFEKMLHGEPLFSRSDKYGYTNDAIISHNQNVDWVYGVDDDAIYVNYRDAGGAAVKRSVLSTLAFS